MTKNPSTMNRNEFTVYLQGVTRTGDVFSKSAGEYKAYMPISGFSHPDGGNSEINNAMTLMLRMAGELTLIISQAMDSHGDKIHYATHTYRITEDNNAEELLSRAVSAPTSQSSPVSGIPGITD